MKIPFDSLTLAAVVAEAQPHVGGKVQKVSSPDPLEVAIEVFGKHGRAELMLNCDPLFARMHFVTRRPPNRQPLPGFCAALRAHLDGAILTRLAQKGFDRVVELRFEGPKGSRTIVAELMGKHSNLILVDESGRIVAAAKTVGPQKSVRPIVPGRLYQPPPFPPRPPVWEAREGDRLGDFEGASPFLVKLMEAQPDRAQALAELRRTVTTADYHPVLVPGSGAYPLSVAVFDLQEHPRSSIGSALEQHYAAAIPRYETEQLKTSLNTQLRRVLLAREAALADLNQAAAAASGAGALQTMGELILAYGPSLPPAAEALDATDYEGNPIQIRLDPELSYLENAQRLFAKAKKAKSGASVRADQIARIGADKADLEAVLVRLDEAQNLADVKSISEEAGKHRWLHVQHAAKGAEPERPYDGHKIRELQGPRGYRVLYGENATSNDYLTTRVAKPNDLWLHVRGGVSAHVVVPTGNHPEKVGPDVLAFAAGIAVQNSVSKHASYVPVDYTLKKYVRKPRGSAAGFAVYTHEKTLHVDNKM